MLIWDNRYSVGIARLDADHVTLLSLLNQLHINLAEEKSSEAIPPVLAALLNYADFHFSYEEHLMERFGYPGAEGHKASHDAFRARVEDLYREDPSSRDIARSLRALLGGWLFDHIVKMDRHLGDWLKARQLNVPDQSLKIALADVGAPLVPV